MEKRNVDFSKRHRRRAEATDCKRLFRSVKTQRLQA
jgi:hypothetical protein